MTSRTASASARADAAALTRLARRSVRVIEAGQHDSGAYVASPSFPVYRYAWFRDGAFVADAMSRAGRTGSAERFFAWCAEVMTARAGRIEELVARRGRGEAVPREELLHCRYELDGREAEDEWWNFQLDGYGSWLWALEAHARRHGYDAGVHGEAVELSVRYLAAFWTEPGYDWWEEHVGHRHTSTLASLYGGLRAASALEAVSPAVRRHATETADAIRETVLAEGVLDGRLVKWLGGDALDASLVACATPFRLLSPADPLMLTTVEGIERELGRGGVHRYRRDTYYGGGQWTLLAALLGWYHVEAGREEDAWAQLRWVAEQANAEGDLPEQVDGRLLSPGHRSEWLARWGPIATPLLWSHAMYLTLALELGAVRAPVAPG
jgi:GH15 family glucan-1,4-alpha-glucosidase